MIQAPIATAKRVNGVAGLRLTFTLVQEGRATDGPIVAHGTRIGDVIIAATDMVTGTNLKTKFVSPLVNDDGLITQSDSNTDHSAAIVMFLIQRG